MQKWMGWSIICAKMWKSLGTKAHQGPAWLNVKCVFGENLKKKKSHNLCVSKERLILYEEQTPSHGLIAFPLFSCFFSYLFSCVSFFSAPPTNQLGRRLRLKVGAGLGSQHPNAGGVAGFAEDVSVQRVAALVISFRQETATILERQTERMSVKMAAVCVKAKFLSFPFKASLHNVAVPCLSSSYTTGPPTPQSFPGIQHNVLNATEQEIVDIKTNNKMPPSPQLT